MDSDPPGDSETDPGPAFDSDREADPLDAAVGRAWRGDYPREFLTRLTELDDRMGGHEGERRAADIVRSALADVGADPEIREFPMPRWTRGSTSLAVSATRDGRPIERGFEALALPYSPPGEVRAPLVDVGHGTPDEIDDADVEGAVAVASTDTPPEKGRFVHRMEKFGHAVEAGAAAFVFANHVPGQLPPTGALRFGSEAAVPGVGVSKETGDWLVDYADAGAEVHLTVDATTDEGTSRNVVGRLGPDTGTGVLAVAHLDAHDRRVWLAGVGCEEIGLLGAEALADRTDADAVRAVVNVDGAGRARDLRAYTHSSDRLRAVAERVVERAGQPLAVTERPHPYSDHWPFLRAGVPALQLHSQAPEGADRGRGWGHTGADTRDKVDPRDLRSHGVLTALIVRELAAVRDLGRIDAADLADRLRVADAERGMRAAGLWPEGWD
ncbi:aminopeptidase [Halobacteriales archaeon QS_5_70_17]|nr:MAG: aminopeptidase [Halobacteriales archaeon QS_5_70_17]